MRHIINFFGLAIIATGRYLLIKFDPEAEVHLRLDPEPQKLGRRSFFTPHVTNERTRKKPVFARIPVEMIEPVMRGIAEDLRDVWVSAHHPVTLEDLDERGWFTIRYDDEHFKRCLDEASLGGGRYKIDEEFFLRFSFPDDGEDRVALPSMLADTPVPLRSPFTIMRVGDEGEIESAFLVRYPDCSDWFLVPIDYLKPEVLDGIYAKHLPRGFWTTIRRMSAALGLGETEKIDAIIERAPHRRTSPTVPGSRSQRSWGCGERERESTAGLDEPAP